MKYTEIRTLKELDSAREVLSKELGRKAIEVADNYDRFRDSFNPANVTANAVKRVSGLLSYKNIALFFVRRAIRKLEK